MVKPTILIILDGWGIAPSGPGNAISQANLTAIPSLWQSYPHSELIASGEGVGLPPNEDGNTETGHVNIGAGRVVLQDLPKINMSIADGSYYRNGAFAAAIAHVNNHESSLHIIGLLSDGGVHSSRDHLYSLLEMVKQHNCFRPVYLHVITDGRDSPPQAGLRFINELEETCTTMGIGVVSTITGRYYAMDRDCRWDRTEKAYVALTESTSRTAKSAREALERSYASGVTDEFVEPTIILDETGIARPRIDNNDAVIFFNYRIDRPRQLTRAFVLPDFEVKTSMAFDPYTIKYVHKHTLEPAGRRPFFRHKVLSSLFFVSMTEYERNLPVMVAFPPEQIHNSLGRVIADHKLRQLRAAESEKERFVTYYFNGLHEDAYPGEDRIIIPSPHITTYDLMPEMSTYELTDRLIDRLKLGVYAFSVVNIACPDMVAHTGNIAAAIKACEATDRCVGEIVSQALAMDGTCFITADHGNVEEMLTADGSMDTEHSTYPVPLMIIQKKFQGFGYSLPKGKLGDVAPTILSHMGIPIPTDMTGNNLLQDFLGNG